MGLSDDDCGTAVNLFTNGTPHCGISRYTLQLIGGAPALILVHRFPENLLQLQAKKTIESHQWHHILAVYDGSGKAAGVKLYVNGELQEAGITIDKLTESFQTEKPLLVGNGYPAAKFVGRIGSRSRVV